MSLGSFVKTIQNIMRGDSGINGDAQRIEQMTWMLFLKVYDAKEEDWEMYCKCVDKLIELLKKVISRAMERSNQLRKLPDCPHGAKYMYAIDVSDMFPDYSAA